MNVELVHAVGEKEKENHKFTINALGLEFPQVSRTIIYGILVKTGLS